jgi:putative endonuclease
MLVFIEVKLRSSKHYGRPIEGVTAKKKRQIKKMALFYCQQRKCFSQAIRFDIITIECLPGREKKITHYQNAFGEFLE